VALAGNLVTSFTPDPDPGFGIRSVAWHPNGLFLAVGGWDDKVGGFAFVSLDGLNLQGRSMYWIALVGHLSQFWS
jgi:WD40 repeat protein